MFFQHSQLLNHSEGTAATESMKRKGANEPRCRARMNLKALLNMCRHFAIVRRARIVLFVLSFSSLDAQASIVLGPHAVLVWLVTNVWSARKPAAKDHAGMNTRVIERVANFRSAPHGRQFLRTPRLGVRGVGCVSGRSSRLGPLSVHTGGSERPPGSYRQHVTPYSRNGQGVACGQIRR